jgi:glutamate formiminotransferase/formiminotetrahydrofolate cyclodeaminase
MQRKAPGVPESELIDITVRSLGLDQLAPFDAQRKIVEYAVRAPARLMSLPVGDFVDEVSSNAPVPGGGSAAALAGSLGAALAAMVANLTVGRAGHDGEELSAMSERAQATKQALAELVDEDARAFNRVMDAMRLPRATEAEKRARDQAVQDAYHRAAEVPLETARLSLAALELARVAALKGRHDAASDAGSAALLARAAVESAALNVAINLQALEDESFVRACRAEVDRLRTSSRRICDEVVDLIDRRLASREVTS